MKMLNKRAPRIDFCVTPKSMLHHSLKLLFILTHWQIALNKLYGIERKPIRIYFGK